MAEHQLPKLTVRVRFPSSAPEIRPCQTPFFANDPAQPRLTATRSGPPRAPRRSGQAAICAPRAERRGLPRSPRRPLGCCADRSGQQRVSRVPCGPSGHAGWHPTERPARSPCGAGRDDGGLGSPICSRASRQRTTPPGMVRNCRRMRMVHLSKSRSFRVRAVISPQRSDAKVLSSRNAFHRSGIRSTRA
jgi:hypothetical protein